MTKQEHELKNLRLLISMHKKYIELCKREMVRIEREKDDNQPGYSP